MVTCVKCGHEQPAGRRECQRCGVILAKAKRSSQRPGGPTARARARAAQSPATARSAGPSPASPKAAKDSRASKRSRASKDSRASKGGGRGRPVRQGDRAVLMGELATLVRSGYSMAEGLESIAGAMGGGVQVSLQSAADQLRQGASLAQALDAPLQLDAVESALLETAQSTGRVAPLLERLAARAKTALEVRRRLRAALMWPMFTLLCAAFLIPFPSLLSKGPATYLWASSAWLGGIAAGVGLYLGFLKLMRRSPGFSRFVYGVSAHLPILSGFVSSRRYSLLFGALGPALDAGLPLPEALRLSQNAAQDPTVDGPMDELRACVDQGRDVLPAIRALPSLPSAAAAQLAGGLKTGRLADACIAIAEEQFGAYQRASDRLGTLLRYSLTLLISLVVGYAIVAQMRELLMNPLSMTGGSGGDELSRELLRALPSMK